ncbi:MAG: hypothetical protein WC070_04080 [Candidatus Magasanikbacteria bacterium]
MNKEQKYNEKSILTLILALSPYLLPYLLKIFHNSNIITMIIYILGQILGIIGLILGIKILKENKKNIFAIISIILGVCTIILFIFATLVALSGSYSSNIY